MNLIEKLGVEKCKQVVEGAPETATNFLNGKYYEEWSHNGWVVSVNGQWEDCKKPSGLMIDINDLRTAIADHGALTSEGARNTDNLSHLTDDCTDIRNHISPLIEAIER